ncbi:hypothetical protein N5F13_24055, partial [Comamonas thiooxydans]|uniref:hypothetical protein n=1 Tax=Comamonas thiooxydans TaxID=363952 RepID=UPI002451F462|nr:hypothetical protein [Comamonas thiooxydans]
MATTPRKDLPSTNAPNWNQRVTEELRVLMGRAGNGRALTAKDLIDSGIAKPGAGGGLVPGVPGGGDTEPDLTPPPMPTGFAVSAGLSTVFVEHDAPGYTQGHGHDRTVVYGVLQTGSTAPTFDQAVVLFQFQGTIGAYPAALGTRYRLWIKWQSQDGVQSVSPAGGINGLDVQTGKIGNNDLGPLIVEAGNLANGSVSATKLAAQAVDATKFASGIEPVGIVSGATLPTVKTTSAIVFGGKLYRWSGTAYTAATAATDVTGQLTDAQLAAISAAKLTGQITGTQITDGAISTPKIAAGAVSASQIAAGAVTAGKIAANAVSATEIAAGAVTAGKIAANAVTANEIAANAVTTAKIAAGAVTAAEVAANAITASKLAISDTTNLIPDQDFNDPAAWTATAAGWSIERSPADMRSQNAVRHTYVAGQVNYSSGMVSKRFAVEAGREYTFGIQSKPASATATYRYWYRVHFYDANSAPVIVGSSDYVSIFVGTVSVVADPVAAPSLQVIAPPGAVAADVRIYVDRGATSVDILFAGLFARMAARGELIVDGAITATKIAANAIAVGTAAIQDGAIVNAMIGNAAIDNAKIANVSAAKLTAGALSVGSYINSSNYI